MLYQVNLPTHDFSCMTPDLGESWVMVVTGPQSTAAVSASHISTGPLVRLGLYLLSVRLQQSEEGRMNEGTIRV